MFGVDVRVWGCFGFGDETNGINPQQNQSVGDVQMK